MFLALGRLDVPTVEVPRTPIVEAPPEPPAPLVLSLRTLLANEIAAGWLEVLDGP